MEVVLLRAGRFKLSPASWRPAWKVLRLQVVVVFRSGPGARPCHRLSTVVVVTDAGRHERLNDHRQFELRPQLKIKYSSTTANKEGRKVMYCGSEFCHYCLLLLVQWKILYERGKCHVQQCILYSVYCKENIGLMKEALRVLNGDKQVRATKTNTASYFCETRQDKTSGTKEGQVLYSQLNSNGEGNISRKGNAYFSILYLLSLPQNLPSVGFWRWQGLEALACW